MKGEKLDALAAVLGQILREGENDELAALLERCMGGDGELTKQERCSLASEVAAWILLG